jgi:hypothetical protein
MNNHEWYKTIVILRCNTWQGPVLSGNEHGSWDSMILCTIQCEWRKLFFYVQQELRIWMGNYSINMTMGNE